ADLAPIENVLLENFPNALKHEPCRRLRHSERTSEFMGTDTVLGIRQQPKRGHPLIKGDRRIFHDCLNLDRELALTGVAEPQLASFDERVFSGIAAWAYNVSIGPAQLLGKLKAAVRVGEVNNCFLECVRFVRRKTIPQAHMCVN